MSKILNYKRSLSLSIKISLLVIIEGIFPSSTNNFSVNSQHDESKNGFRNVVIRTEYFNKLLLVIKYFLLSTGLYSKKADTVVCNEFIKFGEEVVYLLMLHLKINFP